MRVILVAEHAPQQRVGRSIPCRLVNMNTGSFVLRRTWNRSLARPVSGLFVVAPSGARGQVGTRMRGEHDCSRTNRRLPRMNLIAHLAETVVDDRSE